MRACAWCRKKSEAENFIRFVVVNERPVPDLARKLPGRGYNVCADLKCLKGFLKRNFGGRLKEEEVIESLKQAVKEYFLHLLSLSCRAGVVVFGQDAVRELSGRKGCLILARDLSSRTKRRLKKPSFLTVEDILSTAEIHRATGRRAGAVFVAHFGPGRKLYSTAEKLLKLAGER